MKSTIVVAAAALGFVNPAGAQDAGFYLGASVGQTDFKDGCGQVSFDVDLSCDKKDTGFKVFTGYQFNRHLAIELGYAQLGEVAASGVLFFQTRNVRAEVTAWDLVAVGAFPVMERLSLFGKLGFYRAETETSGSDGALTAGSSGVRVPVDFSGSESNTGVTFGFGARYDFTRNLGVRAEWQRYSDVGGDETGESDVDALSLGLVYRF